MEAYCKRMELNCDMGEGFGPWKMGPDEELIKLVDYANIACGFHAGDPSTMLRTVRLAKAHGVKIGAHPGLPDLLGFGRRKMRISPSDLYASILYQVGSLTAMLAAEGLPLNHIKPHGELFFAMQRDPPTAEAVLRACATFDVPVFGAKDPATSQTTVRVLPARDEWIADASVTLVGEAYVDLQFDRHGKLLPVGKSRVATAEEVYERTMSIGMGDHVETADGSWIDMGFFAEPILFCIHSDFANALENAKACRKAIDEINKTRGW